MTDRRESRESRESRDESVRNAAVRPQRTGLTRLRLPRAAGRLLMMALLAVVLLGAKAAPAIAANANAYLNYDGVGLGTNGKVRLTVVNARGRKVTWKSANKSVATVSSKGLVTAQGTGRTTVTATIAKKSLTCLINVTAMKSSTESGLGVRYNGGAVVSVHDDEIKNFDSYTLDRLNLSGTRLGEAGAVTMEDEDDGVAVYFTVYMKADGFTAVLRVPNTRGSVKVKTHSFKAKVRKVYKSSLLVRGLKSNNINDRGDFFLNMAGTPVVKGTKTLSLSDLAKGDVVKVTYSGDVLESDPAQIMTVKKVTLIRKKK